LEKNPDQTFKFCFKLGSATCKVAAPFPGMSRHLFRDGLKVLIEFDDNMSMIDCKLQGILDQQLWLHPIQWGSITH
jgi:hypothetical protein